jgi:hypothetical protein
MQSAAAGPSLAMLVLLLLSMLIGWLIGGPDRESRRVAGDLHRHAQRYCRTVRGAVAFPVLMST